MTVLSLRDLATMPPVEPFLVQDLISSTGITLLTGAPKVGKSRLMTYIGAALASGAESVLGRKLPGKPEIVMFVGADPGSCEEYRTQTLDEIAVMTAMPMYFENDPSRLRTLEDWKGWWLGLPQILGGFPALLVIDNVNALITGTSNNLEDMQWLLQAIEFSQRDGTAVVLLHHPPKTGVHAAGHTGLPARARHLVELTPITEGHLKLTARGNRLPEPVTLTLAFAERGGFEVVETLSPVEKHLPGTRGAAKVRGKRTLRVPFGFRTREAFLAAVEALLPEQRQTKRDVWRSLGASPDDQAKNDKAVDRWLKAGDLRWAEGPSGAFIATAAENDGRSADG